MTQKEIIEYVIELTTKIQKPKAVAVAFKRATFATLTS